MSGKCPVPKYGSLVINTSPADKFSEEKWLMKCLTVSGRVPMNEGILSEACAREFPLASVITQEKSYDSLTTVEKEERSRDAAASSAAAMTLFQSISR